jgi:hypothetical protein
VVRIYSTIQKLNFRIPPKYCYNHKKDIKMNNAVYLTSILFLCIILSCSDHNISKLNNAKNTKNNRDTIDISCLDNYYKVAELFYMNGIKYKDSLKYNCENVDFFSETDFFNNQIVIITQILLISDIDTSNISLLKFSLKDDSEYGCTGYSKQIFQSIGWQPFYSTIKDSVFYQFLLYDSDFKGVEYKGTRLAISAFPISFRESVRYIENYITCKGKCDFSFTIFFDEIPDCLCEWNKNNSNHPITNTGWMLNGDVAYLNDCLFDRALNRSN